MLARFINLGTSLALMAVWLQLVVASLGGRICLRMAPLPVSDGCQNWCCDEYESSVGDSGVELAGQPSPVCPADADCCLVVSTGYYTAAMGTAGVKNLDTFVLVLPAMVSRPNPMDRLIRRVRAYGPEAAMPPPSMAMIRLTVLRL